MAHEDAAGANRPSTARVECSDGTSPEGYEAPRVDLVLSPAGLEREAIYAGTPPSNRF
jgi:hypothetical protein